jgi:hypothetical protein
MPTSGTDTTKIDALATAESTATLWAVTVTGPEGTVAGAVYVPEVEIVPVAEFPPTVPLTSQFRPALLVPETDALNCSDWPT